MRMAGASWGVLEVVVNADVLAACKALEERLAANLEGLALLTVPAEETAEESAQAHRLRQVGMNGTSQAALKLPNS